MLSKRNALLAAGAAVLVAVAGDRAATASDQNWFPDYYGGKPWAAISGGVDTNGLVLYFCRAYLASKSGYSGYQPGKMNANLGACNYPYGGKELTDTNYEVLVPHWESASGGQPAGSPYPAGTDSDGTPLYFCRAMYNGGLHPGKLKPGVGCYIPWGGNEILLNYYDVFQNDLPVTTRITISACGYPCVGRIRGGYEANQASYLDLCVAHEHGTQPGKWVPADGTCHYSYAGREVSTTYYDLLSLNNASIPYPERPLFDFVVGEDTNGQPLYACAGRVEADSDRSLQLGKYRQDFPACDVGWGGSEWLTENVDQIVDGIALNGKGG